MADEPIQTDDTKLTRTKRQWAEEGRFLTGRISRPETERLPPGQHLVKNWPVLDLGQQPQISTAQWRLDIHGLVSKPTSFDWPAFLALPQIELQSDIHCVTTWSRYENAWTGVSTRALLDAVDPKPEATAVMLTSYDGYTTNLLLSDFAVEDALLVHRWPVAARSATSLFLEKRQVVEPDRIPLRRQRRLLGAERLPHARRPMG
jgi:DMSO/TMAO reductase YedYZ molybdopterin-dependent catalytic subunit